MKWSSRGYVRHMLHFAPLRSTSLHFDVVRCGADRAKLYNNIMMWSDVEQKPPSAPLRPSQGKYGEQTPGDGTADTQVHKPS
jgi:hypothetical protein